MSDKINAALFKALPTLESAKRNAANPHLKSKYANLSAVMAAVEPVKEFGLWYRQVQHPDASGACVETIYIHESGEELSAGKTFVKADKLTPQGFGSALTYARRYSLQGAFGLDAEDDDGHVASQPQKQKKVEPPLSVEAFLDNLRLAYRDGDPAEYWTTHWPSVPQEWRAYAIEQKEQIKEASEKAALATA